MKIFVKEDCSVTVTGSNGELERFLTKQGFSLHSELTEEEVAKLAKPKRKKRAASKTKK